MIDLHCHVLPGIDDGPATVEESLALCREALAAGTRTIVATPHVSWEHPNDAAGIAEACARLTARLTAERIALDVLPGAEVALTRALELPDEELRALTLGGGPWLLVEPPFTGPATGFADLLERLAARGHRLVVAHPERIGGFHRDPAVLGRLVEAGMATAVTASAFAGAFGRPVQRFARDLVRDGLVDAVASDAHGPGGARSPDLRAGLAAAGLEAWADQLCAEAPQAILAGAPLPPRPAVPAERGGRLARLLRR